MQRVGLRHLAARAVIVRSIFTQTAHWKSGESYEGYSCFPGGEVRSLVFGTGPRPTYEVCGVVPGALQLAPMSMRNG